jgi:hypothetical protein
MNKDLLKMIGIGVGLAILVTCGVGGLSLLIQKGTGFIRPSRPALITKLAVPSVTPNPTPALQSTNSTNVNPDGVMTIGAVVQISGTGNVGLRLRQSPGTDGAPQFVAMENEVFVIQDGPVTKDGITWWLLSSSYDKNRQGWAAGQYLKVFAEQ